MQHHNYSLGDIESMMPFEREIYVQMLIDYIKEENKSIKSFQISISIGVSKVDLKKKAPLDDAIKDADKEMYRVKVANKKNRK